MAGRAQSAEELALEKVLFPKWPGRAGREERCRCAERLPVAIRARRWELVAGRGTPSSEKAYKEIELEVVSRWDLLKRVVLGRGVKSYWEAAGETGRGKRWMVAAQQLRHWKEGGSSRRKEGMPGMCHFFFDCCLHQH